tara:strand:+ start:348 stop:623 length:276 start_codon:yes stop_codon:yes gene_type:complete
MRNLQIPSFGFGRPKDSCDHFLVGELHLYWQKGARLARRRATAEEAYRYAIRHDILGRQDLSQAAGAAAEHERADAREPERGRVEPRVVRF